MKLDVQASKTVVVSSERNYHHVQVLYACTSLAIPQFSEQRMTKIPMRAPPLSH